MDVLILCVLYAFFLFCVKFDYHISKITNIAFYFRTHLNNPSKYSNLSCIKKKREHNVFKVDWKNHEIWFFFPQPFNIFRVKMRGHNSRWICTNKQSLLCCEIKFVLLLFSSEFYFRVIEKLREKESSWDINS